MESNTQASPQTTTPPHAEQAVISVQRTTLNYVVVGIVFLLIGVVIGAVGNDRFGSGGVTEERLRTIVNGALEANRTQTQEMITTAFEQYAASQNPDEQRFEVASEGNPTRGAENPIVQVIGFEDFRCGYCKRFNDETVAPLLEAYGDTVQFVFRDYPILGQDSVESALAAACAHDQGAFWEFHDRFYSNQADLTRAAFITYATELALDLEQFTACYDNREHEQAVYNDFIEGRDLGISGTPTFFVNGRRLIGAQPFNVFAAIIEEEIAAAQSSQDAEVEEAAS